MSPCPCVRACAGVGGEDRAGGARTARARRRARFAAGTDDDARRYARLTSVRVVLFFVRGQSNGGKTAAMFAASGGHVDVLKAMQRGPSLLDLPSADGGTAAMSAAAHGYGDVLSYIIEKKCNLNAQDEDGWTALMYAVAAGNVENVQKLIAAGANPKIKNNDGEDAAKLAAGKNKAALLAALKGKMGTIKEDKKCCMM